MSCAMAERFCSSMTDADPYDPPVSTLPEAERARVAFVWNFVIGAAVALLVVFACYGIIRFHAWAFSSDDSTWIATEMFLRQVSSSVAPLLGLCLFLFSMSTYSFHTRRRQWQVIYAIVVVILAFDFFSLAITSAAMARACVFAVFFLPVLVCGCGWPRAISQSIAFLRARP